MNLGTRCAVVVAWLCVMTGAVHAETSEPAGDTPAVRGEVLLHTLAGNGAPTFAGDGGPADRASLHGPTGVVVAADSVFIADHKNHRVRRVDRRSGVIETVAGNGTPGFDSDGGPAVSAALWNPADVAVDPEGNLLIADRNNHRVRRVSATSGAIETLAGNGEAGFDGDGGPAVRARLFAPRALLVDDRGNVFVADRGNHRVRRIDAEGGVIRTVAGNGRPGFGGDGGPADRASLHSPSGLAFDAAGNLLIADRDNHRIRRVDASDGRISTFAGTGKPGLAGDGGSAIAASLQAPSALAVQGDGSLYIADLANHCVRRVDLDTNQIETVTGLGDLGFGRDRLLYPSGLDVDSAGRLYIADSANQRVRVTETPRK